MSKNKLRVFIFLFCFSNILLSQEQYFQNQTLKLIDLADIILNGKTDSIRKEANTNFQTILSETLNTDKSYLHDFQKIKHLSILKTKNKKFKLFTWFLPYENGTYNYFGLIQRCKKNGKKCELYYLESNAVDDNLLLNKKLAHYEWYGCLYYDIIPIEINKTMYYTLLGWDGNNNKTTKKIIDVLTLGKKTPPYFGANIFNNQKNRIIIEYSSQYSISLKYDKELECIVFDHIEPIDGVSTNNFNLYAPNLSYDIFKKTDLGWRLETNIYLNNNE